MAIQVQRPQMKPGGGIMNSGLMRVGKAGAAIASGNPFTIGLTAAPDSPFGRAASTGMAMFGGGAGAGVAGAAGGAGGPGAMGRMFGGGSPSPWSLGVDTNLSAPGFQMPQFGQSFAMGRRFPTGGGF